MFINVRSPIEVVNKLTENLYDASKMKRIFFKDMPLSLQAIKSLRLVMENSSSTLLDLRLINCHLTPQSLAEITAEVVFCDNLQSLSLRGNVARKHAVN